MIRSLISIAVLLLAGNSTLQANAAQMPWGIIVSGPANPQKLYSSITVSVILRNTSNYSTGIGSGGGPDHGEIMFAVDVRDAEGQLVNRTEYGRAIFDEENSSIFIAGGPSVALDLAPGDEIRKNITISDLYNFSKPGSYFVTVRKEVPGVYGGGTINSNTVEIHVQN